MSREIYLDLDGIETKTASKPSFMSRIKSAFGRKKDKQEDFGALLGSLNPLGQKAVAQAELDAKTSAFFERRDFTPKDSRAVIYAAAVAAKQNYGTKPAPNMDRALEAARLESRHKRIADIAASHTARNVQAAPAKPKRQADRGER